jgi:hypothetical protein
VTSGRDRDEVTEDLGAANLQSMGAGGEDERDAGDLGVGGGAGAARAIDPVTRRSASAGRRSAEPVTEGGSGESPDPGDDAPGRGRPPEPAGRGAPDRDEPITAWPGHRERDEPGVDVPPG